MHKLRLLIRQLRFFIVSCIWVSLWKERRRWKRNWWNCEGQTRRGGKKKPWKDLSRRWGGLGEEEEDKRRSPSLPSSLPASRMGRKKEWGERKQRRRGGRSEEAGETVSVWGLSEAFINESRCLALWTCRVADGDGGDGALDSPDGYHSLSSSCLSTAFPPSARRGERVRKEGETERKKKRETDNIQTV